MKYKALGSIENRFREAYNKGYKDGLRDGASQVTAKLVSKILEETEADTPQTDCEKCEHWKYIAHEWQCETEKCQMTTPQTVQKIAEFQKMYGIKIDPDRIKTDCGWK